MTETSLLTLVALEWVNTIRAEQGQLELRRMPKGARGTGYRCPIANAIRIPECDVYVGRNWCCWRDDGNTQISRSFPDAVTEFVRSFDAGEIPELVS